MPRRRTLTRRDFVKTSLVASSALALSTLVPGAWAARLAGPGVTMEMVEQAAAKLKGQVRRTPLVHAGMLAKRTGVSLFLKLESMQYTGAFKERGAFNKMSALGREERSRGVIAASSGNHAQAVAHHATRLGIPSLIVMPRVTPQSKIRRTLALGGEVIVHGAEFDDSLAFALGKAQAEGLTFIHPFNDPLVMAGQGTVGLEIMQDLPEAEVLIAPVGGGGLIAGCATAAKAINPKLRVYGVEAKGYVTMHQMLHKLPVETGGETLAEGIAVHSVGKLSYAIDQRLLEDVLVVDEEQIARAITLLWAERKLVAEGAGAVGVAALLQHAGKFAGKKVAAVISGGNIDARLFATLLQRDLRQNGRLAQIRVISRGQGDIYPRVAVVLAQNGAKVVNLQYDPIFHAASPMSTAYDLIIETRDRKHAEAVIKGLNAAGFRAVFAP